MPIVLRNFGIQRFSTVIPEEGGSEESPAGFWTELTDSLLNQSGVYPPSPAPPGNDTATVMIAWSGGLWDWRRLRLIIHGGGHADYAGNEIYAFSLIAGTWSRIWGPTANASIPNPPAADGADTYTNGDPCSVHTYDGLIYLPDLDVYFRVGGSRWSLSGAGTPATWFFNPNDLTWTRKSDWPFGGVSCTTAYDPSRGIIWAAGAASQIAKYDVATDVWTQTGTQMGGMEEANLCIDPDNDVGVFLGNGQIWSINLSTGATTERTTTGSQTIVNARGPGLVFDPVLRKIVGWFGGTSLYSLNTSTWAWTEHTPDPANTVTPPTVSGTRVAGGFPYGKFQYIPSHDIYIVVNSVDTSVYTYRLSDNPYPQATWISTATSDAGEGPYPTGGKHSRMAFDSRRGRVCVTGGDYTDVSPNASDNGNARIWARDIRTIPVDNSWISLHDYCSASGQLMPGRPDNVGWVYDPKRDRFYTFPGFYFSSQGATGCEAGGSVIGTSAVQFDPTTGFYSAVSWPAPDGGYGGDLGAKFAVLDPILDRVHRFRYAGNAYFEILDLASNIWLTRIQITYGDIPTIDFSNDQSAIDVIGRGAYCYLRTTDSSVGYLLKVNLTDYSYERFVVPSALTVQLSTLNELDQETYMVFDSVNRKIFLFGGTPPASYSMKILTMGVFDVDAETWSLETPSSANVDLNMVGFDEMNGVIVARGRISPYNVWYYRHNG